MNLKAGHEFEQRHLDAEFGQSNFFLPNFKKINFDFVSKSYNRFTKPPLIYGFEGAVPTWIGNRVKQRT
jgi:hypothetical protein